MPACQEIPRAQRFHQHTHGWSTAPGCQALSWHSIAWHLAAANQGSHQARFGIHMWVDEVLGPGPEAYSVLQVPILCLVTIVLCTERVAESETDALLLGFGGSMNLYAPLRPPHYPGQVFLRCVGLTTTGGSKGFGLSVIHARRSYTSFECLADGRDVTSPKTLSRLQSLQKAETRLCGAAGKHTSELTKSDEHIHVASTSNSSLIRGSRARRSVCIRTGNRGASCGPNFLRPFSKAPAKS